MSTCRREVGHMGPHGGSDAKRVTACGPLTPLGAHPVETAQTLDRRVGSAARTCVSLTLSHADRTEHEHALPCLFLHCCLLCRGTCGMIVFQHLGKKF